MRTLKFTIKKQILRKKSDCDFSRIIAGTVGYLYVKFHFDSDWTDCKKAVSFWIGDKEYPVLLDENDSCTVPPEVTATERFDISILGIRPDYKIGTNKFTLRQDVN